MPKRILILGGGTGGVVVARKLSEHLTGDEAEIVLIDKNGRHLFWPSLLWVMAGTREVDDISRPLQLLEKRGIKVVVDEVTKIDPANNKVITKGGEYTYDYLVVALGATPRPDLLPGNEHICAPWTPEGALKCRKMLAEFRGGRVVIGTHDPIYKCAPAPFEAAFLIKYLMEQRGVTNVDITVFHQWKDPMEPFGPFMVSMFKRFLDMYNIKFVGGKPNVARVEEGRVVFEDNSSIEFDLGIVVPPHEPPPAVAQSELANPKAYNYMLVELPTLRHPKYKNVFGVGDIIEPTIGLGMAGVFAHFQGEYVASQIIDEIKGTFMGEHYNMTGVCVMDMGYMGAAVFCDFKDKLLGRAQYPDCYMIGGMRLFRAVKATFEKLWFDKFF